MSDFEYEAGLHKITDSAYAWLLPDGSWGWSNAGLIVGDGESLLFDTLYDLNLTADMLNGIKDVTKDAPVKRLINSHGNGDHFYGNELMGDDVEILATSATQEMMRNDNPQGFEALKEDPGATGKFFREYWHHFDFTPIKKRLADTLFEDELKLDVGGVEVHVKDLGPAHTDSDSILHLPSESVVYAADLLFIGGTPIAWSGPIHRWIDALNYIISLDAEYVVPGHGPITDNDAVAYMRGYLEYVLDGANEAFEKGIPALEAARAFDLGEYKSLQEGGRIIQNFLNVYHHRGIESTLTTAEIIHEIALLEGFED